jgi:hypothetical protein
VIHLQILTGAWRQTLFVFTKALFQLQITGRRSKIGGRTSYVVDISLEVFQLREHFGLSQYAFCASNGDLASLVIFDGAEITGTVASSIVNNGKLDLFDGRNSAKRLVGRVVVSHIRQLVYLVKLLRA